MIRNRVAEVHSNQCFHIGHQHYKWQLELLCHHPDLSKILTLLCDTGMLDKEMTHLLHGMKGVVQNLILLLRVTQSLKYLHCLFLKLSICDIRLVIDHGKMKLQIGSLLDSHRWCEDRSCWKPYTRLVLEEPNWPVWLYVAHSFW